MANRILIINNDNSQELPLSVMDRFQQVMLVVGKGQNNLPIEIVSQLLLAQAQHKVQIELMAITNTSKPVFDLHFAMQLGRLLERNPDPDEAAVRRELSGNLCRCGTHVEIIRAVLRAAVLMREAQA